MDWINNSRLHTLFSALDDALGEESSSVSLVVVGGAAMMLGGWVERTTQDIDVIAISEQHGSTEILQSAAQLPEELKAAIARVARDFALPEDWMNSVVASMWELELPPSLLNDIPDINWIEFKHLRIGFIGRQTLIPMKLYAAVDSGPESVHYQDLLALKPDRAEMEDAFKWVSRQDGYEGYASIVKEVMENVLRDIGID